MAACPKTRYSILDKVNKFLSSPKVQTCSGMQPTWVPGVLSPSINGRGVKLTSHLHVVPSLGMYGDIPLRSHDLKIDITLNSCFPVRDTNILEKLLSHLSRNLTCCNTLLGFYILKKEAVKYSESV